MNRTSVWALVVFMAVTTALVPGCDSGREPTAARALDRSSPAGAASSLYAAMSASDAELVGSVLDLESPQGRAVFEGYKQLLGSGVVIEAAVIEVEELETSGSRAVVRVNLHERFWRGNDLAGEGGAVTWLVLTKKENRWYVVGEAPPLSP